MIYESKRKMTYKEQEAYDLGYMNGKHAAMCSPWVKTSDRLPTEADADDEGKVTALITGSITGKLLSLSLYYKSLTADSADYFLPLPKLPEVEE
jgi:SH3-like domain-containing protein